MATVLITGASRGIGLALARRAAGRGDAVIACARDPETPDLVALEGVRREALDVVDPAACTALADRLAGETIDLLVCNAGVYKGRGRIDDAAFAPEDWAETFAVNVAGVFHTVRALRPLMRRPGGRVAVISSRMGSNAEANGGSYIYRASKAAATNLGRNLATDLAPRGIALGIYHPGWVRTDMGGAGADISLEDSVAGLMDRFDALSLATTGAFLTWNGRPHPF